MKEESKLYQWKDSDMDIKNSSIDYYPPAHEQRKRDLDELLSNIWVIIFGLVPSIVAILSLLYVLFLEDTSTLLRVCILGILIGVYKLVTEMIEATK